MPGSSDDNGDLSHDPEKPVDPATEGLGAFQADLTRADLRMIGASANRRWNTDQRVKDALLAKAAATALRSKHPRTIFAGLRAYIMAERQNQNDEHKHMPDRVEHAHLHVDVRQAVDGLTLEELRVIRKLNKRRQRLENAAEGAIPAEGDSSPGLPKPSGNGHGRPENGEGADPVSE